MESLLDVASDMLSEGGAGGYFKCIACAGLCAELPSLFGVPIIGDNDDGLATLDLGMRPPALATVTALEPEEDFLRIVGAGA